MYYTYTCYYPYHKTVSYKIQILLFENEYKQNKNIFFGS